MLIQLFVFELWVLNHLKQCIVSLKLIILELKQSKNYLILFTVPLIYNFTFTRMYTHGTMQYLVCKNPWFAVEKFFSMRQVMAFSRHLSWHFHDTCHFHKTWDFHVTSHSIYTQRAWPWSFILLSCKQTHEKSYCGYSYGRYI